MAGGTLTEIIQITLEPTSLTTGEVAQWITDKKPNNFYRPLSTDRRGLFSFGVHGTADLVGWTVSSSADRAFSVTVENDDFMFFVERETCYELATGGIRHAITPTTGLLTMADRYSGVGIQAGSIAEGFCITRASVLSAFIRTFDRPLPSDFEFAPMQDLTTGPAQHLFKLMRIFRDEVCANRNIGASPIALASFQEVFGLLMVQNLRHTSSHVRSPVQTIAPRQVRRALEFAKAHIAMPITISDMAEAAGVSVRTLQFNFHRFLNKSPMTYLRQLRLDGARHDLLTTVPSSTVNEIALRWGFTHRGRFSQEYRAAFGVPPSADLGRKFRA
ncbi:AraC family transcriptional regulator protein (plasmid) [Rhizobium sp. NXC24]|nr:AraC family transcriptional regulator protein [Rhizobium sp. NXC24]